MSSSLTDLNNRFQLPGLRFEYGPGRLIRAVVDTPVARGELFLNGAHVSGWQPTGHQPVLWMSNASQFAVARPIRGGVPLCFPWFGPHHSDPAAPAHGFARLQKWDIINATKDADSGIRLQLQTTIGEFALQYDVLFGNVLEMTLQVGLPDNHPHPESCEEALHTYFNISDIHKIRIHGLEQAAYVDKVPVPSFQPASNKPIEFTTETDRIYQGTNGTVQLIDPIMQRIITIEKAGSESTVVWNPWIAKSSRMADFGDHEWTSMVCIETANVGDHKILLQPGHTHRITARISVSAI